MDENIMGECLPLSSVFDWDISGLTLSPNPATDAFTIQTSNHTSLSFEMAIMTMDGIECTRLKNVSTGDQVDITGLASGMYIVNLLAQNGIWIQQKLVIP
jgi:hypothetical protein